MSVNMSNVKAITHNNKQVSKIEDSNGNIIWGSYDAFPYRRLEYIHFSGAEYIQSDYNLATKQRKMILEYSLTDKINNMTLMGQWDGTAANNQARVYCVRYNTSSNMLRAAIGNTTTNPVHPDLNVKYKSTVTYTNASNPTLVVEIKQGNTTLLSQTITQTGVTSVSSFGTIGKIGCSTEKPVGSTTTSPTHYWHGNLYFYEKYRTDTNVLQNRFIPAQRKSDGVCGCYDIVKQEFKPMIGTTITDAAAGPIVDEYWDLQTY